MRAFKLMNIDTNRSEWARKRKEGKKITGKARRFGHLHDALIARDGMDYDVPWTGPPESYRHNL